MQKIKLLFFITIYIVSARNLSAQVTPVNKDALMLYFKSNIHNLDPIEGLYDVNIEQWGENSFRTFPPNSTNVTMSIYKDKTGVFKILEVDNVTIKRVGSSSIYNYNILWKGSNATTSKRINLLDRTIFDVSYSIPDQQLRYDMGNNYQAGLKVNYKNSFIKVFPTPDMYKKYITKKRAEELEKPKVTEWTGTGFALNKGYIVTNFHVIENSKSITVQGVNGNFTNKYNANVIATDKYNDLALLQISDKRFNGFGAIPYSVKTSVSDVGEEVFVLGYPLTSTMGSEIKLSTGIISSKSGFQGDISLYQISAPIQPGNSGGPLFDNNGNLIGIISAKHKNAENVGYAIKTSYLRNLVESTVSEPILPTSIKISNLPLTGKVKNLKNFVFIISCSDEVEYSSFSSNTPLTSSVRTIKYPEIRKVNDISIRLKEVKLSKDYTAIVISYTNQSNNVYYQWCCLDKNAHIIVDGKKYTLTKAEGIEIAPGRTYFTQAGQSITFTLYFPPIPNTATTMDFIESTESPWKIYGIKVK